MIDDRDSHWLCVTDWLSEQCSDSRLIQVLIGRPLHHFSRVRSQPKNTLPRSGVPVLVYRIKQSQSRSKENLDCGGCFSCINYFLVRNHCLASIKSQLSSRHSLVCWALMGRVGSVVTVVVDTQAARDRVFHDYLFPLRLR